jgi:ABC-type transport system substrate-binding protein
MTMYVRKTAVQLWLLIVILSLASSSGGYDDQENEPLQSAILKVGAQQDIQTSNLLWHWISYDVWTANVLRPVYGGVGQQDPDTERPIPYLLKGIDADENGAFDLDEYGIYKKEGGTDPFQITAYYDFNGVLSHDGVQMTMHDLLFGYHVRALSPQSDDVDVLRDMSGLPGSNYTTSRWLNVWPVPDTWDPIIPVGSNDTLTFALHFYPQGVYADLARLTINGIAIVPRHIWEGTGKVCLQSTIGICDSWRTDIHSDFGYAYDEFTRNGVPAPDPSAFMFNTAAIWSPNSDEVIGTGPFTFSNWETSVSVQIDRYEEHMADVLDCVKLGMPPVCQGNFFSYMHKPYIDGMVFLIYNSEPDAVTALHAGDIDVISWSLPRSYAADLLADTNIEMSMTLEDRFYYLGYNMRSSPLGYPNNDPAQGDDGYNLRKAIAYLIDKGAIVTIFLQDYGVPGNQPVFPTWSRWFNTSITGYEYNLTVARQILDDYYTIGGFALGYNASGFRNLPTIGDQELEIICPQAVFDPIRAAACDMTAENMTTVGLNATANHLTFAEISNRLAIRNMDMWILGWIIGSQPPDYYYVFFHSDDPGGLNYPGFDNATYDNLLDNATAEHDPDRQEALIKECSGILADALPYDTLYFIERIEAYRKDRFVNWTVGVEDSIFVGSFWSWIGVHPPISLSVDIIFPYGNSVNEMETLLFEVSVTDGVGNPVDNATVTISSSPAGPTILPDVGMTANGTMAPIAFVAPNVVGSNRYFSITAVASKWESSGNDTDVVAVLNVHPPTLTRASLSGFGHVDVTVEWTLSMDDGQGDFSVIGYDVLRGNAYDPDGNYSLHDSIPNGTTQYTDSGAGEGDLGNYFYVICAVDLNWNRSCSSEQAAKFTRPLAPGLNLISIPLLQSDEGIEIVLQTVKYDRAWYSDSSSQEWEWYMISKTYRRGLFDINHTMGMWVNVTQDSNLTVAGIVPAQTAIQLYEGWNLVSFPSFNSSYTVADLKAEAGATRVEGYAPAPPYHLRVLEDAEVLLAGYGYWVKVDIDVDWIVEVS